LPPGSTAAAAAVGPLLPTRQLAHLVRMRARAWVCWADRRAGRHAARAARRYPNLLPLPAEEVERIRAAVKGWGLDFDCLYGGAPPCAPAP